MTAVRSSIGPTTQPCRPTPLRVLVIEDDPDCAGALAAVLALYGHRPEVAGGGPAALAAARAHPPDVVLTDLNLPGMDGFELAGWLRDLLRNRPLLIALTGHADDATRRRSADEGFDHHLVKPVAPEELRGLLQDYAASLSPRARFPAASAGRPAPAERWPSPGSGCSREVGSGKR
jgi:CheY-like chemotaxis protein